jgi:hypothetical protein
VCNGGTWKIPARPGEASSEARSARRRFPKEIIPDFSREILEKNPVILEKNPVLLFWLHLRLVTDVHAEYYGSWGSMNMNTACISLSY